MNFYQHDVEKLAEELEGRESVLARKKKKVTDCQGRWPLLAMYENSLGRVELKNRKNIIFQKDMKKKEASKPLFSKLNKKKEKTILPMHGNDKSLHSIFNRIASKTSQHEPIEKVRTPQISGSMFRGIGTRKIGNTA